MRAWIFAAVAALAVGQAEAAVVKFDYYGPTLFFTPGFVPPDPQHFTSPVETANPETKPGRLFSITLDMDQVGSGFSWLGGDYLPGDDPRPAMPDFVQDVTWRSIFESETPTGISMAFDGQTVTSWRIFFLWDNYIPDEISSAGDFDGATNYDDGGLMFWVARQPGHWRVSEIDSSPVPLPATAPLLGAALFGLWRFRRPSK